MRTLGRLSLCALTLAALAGRPAAAQLRVHRTFTVDDGLPQSQVTALARDGDGFLWLATYDGVGRFDGARFESYRSAGEGSLGIVSNLVATAAGEVLGNTLAGPVVLGGGSARPLRPPGLAEAPLRAVAAAGGATYVLTEQRIASLPRTGPVVPLSLSRALPLDRLESAFAAGPRLLLAFRGGGLALLAGDGAVTPVERAPGLAGAKLHAALQATDGTILVGTERGLARLAGGRLELAGEPLPGPVLALAETAAGELLAGTAAAGLYHRVAGRWRQVGEPHGLVSPRVNALLAVGDTVYAGTDRGLAVYDGGRVESWTRGHGLASDVVWQMERDAAGRTWAGTDRGVVVIEPDGRLRSLGGDLGMVRALAVDRGRGRVLAGTDRGEAYSIAADGRVARLRRAGESGFVKAVRRPDGGILFASRTGIEAVRGDALVPIPAPLPPDAVVLTAAAGRGDALYVGTTLGLLAWRGGSWRRLGRAEGLADDLVLSVLESDGGRLIVGTGRGITVLDGREARVVAAADGLASEMVNCLAWGGDGLLYATTNAGLYAVEPAAARPVVRHLDRRDGLAGTETNLAACAADETGRVWVGTVGGISAYDPRREPRRPPPRVGFASLAVDGTALPRPAAGEPLRLGRDRRGLVATLRAVDLGFPSRVRYRHRLRGADERWTPSEDGRVSYASFEPGEYALEAQAAAGLGPWGPSATLPLVVSGPLWQRWWFIPALATSALAAAGLVLRVRYRQLVAIQGLRATIAADLHDHIGTGLTEVVILSELAAQRAGPARAELEKVAETSRTLIDRMGDIVWLVNPERDTLEELFLKLRDVYADLFAHAGVAFRTGGMTALKSAHLPMDYRHGLYLIFKEALSNALRHSGCRVVELEALLAGSRLEVTLRDDGCGFEQGRELGEGLRNMRQRAARLGGTLVLDTEPGVGTTIRFSGRLARAGGLG
jgi:ligand-binding sensor domain-containing protein/two-component sensor histidine kinase